MYTDNSIQSSAVPSGSASGGAESPTPWTLSPALQVNGSLRLPAYELKFLVNEDLVSAIESWCRRLMTPDPHGDPALNGAYQTTSLYADTFEWDVFRRTPGYRRRKFRIRRYGSMPGLFVEQKSKNGARVWKKRSLIDDGSLVLLSAPVTPPEWSGRWFHDELHKRRLRPACRITYLRRAWIGVASDGNPLRLTIDRDICGVPCGDWFVQPVQDGRRLLVGQAIVEIKFRAAVPSIFKQLISDLGLAPTTASKYRHCCEVWGTCSSAQGAASA